MYRSLTSLRGLFAIAIVLYHRQWHAIDGWEHCGVTFFFMLSGFLLTLHHDFTMVSWRSWRQFFVLRVRRIYPLHLIVWAMFVAVFVAFSMNVNWWAAILNAILMHAWVPVREFYLSVNKPIWFLSALIFCYACFPLVRTLTHRVRLWCQMLAILLVMIALWCLLPSLSPALSEYLYCFPPIRLIEFSLGVVLAQLLRVLPVDAKTSLTMTTVVELTSLSIVVMMWGIAHFTGIFAAWEDVLIWWLPVAVLIFVVAAHHGHEGWVCRVLSWRPLQWLGEISYEVYVLQNLIPFLFSYLVSPVLTHFGIVVYGMSIPVHLILLVLTAWAVHRYFTKPLSQISPIK